MGSTFPTKRQGDGARQVADHFFQADSKERKTRYALTESGPARGDGKKAAAQMKSATRVPCGPRAPPRQGPS